MTPCEGTACNNEAKWRLVIRADLAAAFDDPSAGESIVERNYCEDCTKRARSRTVAQVLTAWPLGVSPTKATGEQP